MSGALPLWVALLVAVGCTSVAIGGRALWIQLRRGWDSSRSPRSLDEALQKDATTWRSASSAGTVTTKPWGSELLWARTSRYAGKVLRVRGSEALSLQYHRVKDETLMVLSGRVRLEHYARGAARVLGATRPWEVFHVPPGLRHRIVALEDAEVLEVSSPELDDVDVVRLEDRYGRTEEGCT